jgi:putative restriction endonuclease
VKFWRPASNQGFRALEVGEPFFFKSLYPHNRIVGGGIYSGFARLPISEAWTYFGEGNGTTSLERMREAISRYRKASIHFAEDPVIGCVFVRAVKFFTEDTSMAPPPDFASNIV